MYEPDELDGGCYGCRSLARQLDAEREKVKELEATVERYKAQQIGLQNINIMNQATMEAELAAAQATIAEMREALEEAVEDTLWIPKAKKILALPTNQDALHEALARECDRLSERIKDEGNVYASFYVALLRKEAAAHRARKENEQ